MAELISKNAELYLVKLFADKSGVDFLFLFFVVAFVICFASLSTAWTDTAVSEVFASQGSLFGVLGDCTAGADADVSVLYVVSELESDQDTFQK